MSNTKKPQPARGMRDILPGEGEVRIQLMKQLIHVYHQYGFQLIETPALENIEILSSGQGGDTEKAIFKVLKRGEKLQLQQSNLSENELVDLALRYDLTVPLARFYASNRGLLPNIFKSIQIGPVWRAERPQKGRFRQFTQCDIDIIGDSSILAEIELINATRQALQAIGLQNFTIHLNDRRILIAAADFCGFPAESHQGLFITLDKIDKIGEDKVQAELIQQGHNQDQISKILNLLKHIQEESSNNEMANLFKEKFSVLMINLKKLISVIAHQANNQFTAIFNPLLVRGLGYYTGPIFEITYPGYSFSIAGGGRYDEMIDQLIGINIPAVGFSIGFERIITILLDQQKITKVATGIAILITHQEDYEAALALAQKYREQNIRVTVLPKEKNSRFQLQQLQENGWESFCIYNHTDKEQLIKKL